MVILDLKGGGQYSKRDRFCLPHLEQVAKENSVELLRLCFKSSREAQECTVQTDFAVCTAISEIAPPDGSQDFFKP